MKFGRVAVAASEGVILAHAIRGSGLQFRKGELLGAEHVAALEQAGITSIIGARLEPGDIDENAAALRLARHVAGGHVRLDRAFTGRCNLLSATAGLVCVNKQAVDSINAIDESITVATLQPFEPVHAGEMIATVKIIPFAVRDDHVQQATTVRSGAVVVVPFQPLRVGVASTMLPALKPSTVIKTLNTLQERLAPAAAAIVAETRVAHDARALAAAIMGMRDVDLIVVFGASAITDRRDVVPVAIELAGGEVEHLGMPVDPGNLLLLGSIERDERRVRVIGAPGCARSPKENGFDFVLRRLLAGIPVTGADLRGMGVGGLLNEIVSRPQLRQAGDG